MTSYDDFNVYDMALELAERESVSLSVSEMLELAEKVIDERWITEAEERPDVVLALYEQSFPGQRS